MKPHPSPYCPKCGYGTLFTKDGIARCTREGCDYKKVVKEN